MKIHSRKNAIGTDHLPQLHQILEEHKLQGEEDQALEKRVGKKKAAAKKRATRKSKMNPPLPPLPHLMIVLICSSQSARQETCPGRG